MKTASTISTSSDDPRRAFRATPDRHQYVPLDSVEQELEPLLGTVVRGDGIVVLTAAPGAGKTAVCRHLQDRLDGDFEAVVLSSSEFATRRSLLQAILFELGEAYEGLTEQELRLAMLNHARSNLPHRRGIVLIVDEAHLLNARLLEELRCLTNHAENGETLIRVVLSAQLALEEMLTLPELQALNYRITSHTTLEPLSILESAELVSGRLRHVGQQVESVFTADALETICRVSDGSPRCLVQLCDHTLSRADETDQRPVGVEVVRRALKDLKQLPLQWNESTIDQAQVSEVESSPAQAVETDWPPVEDDTSWASYENLASPSSSDESESDEPLEWAYDVPSVEVGETEAVATTWEADVDSECWSTFETDGDAETDLESEPPIIADDERRAAPAEHPPSSDETDCSPAQIPATTASSTKSESDERFVEIPVDDRYAVLDEQSGRSTERLSPSDVFDGQTAIALPASAEISTAADLTSESVVDAGESPAPTAPVDGATNSREPGEADGGVVAQGAHVSGTEFADDLPVEIPAVGFDVVQPHWGEAPGSEEGTNQIDPQPLEPTVGDRPLCDGTARRPYARLFSRLRRERV